MNVPSVLYNWSFYRILVWLIPIVFEVVIEFLGIFDPRWPTFTGLVRKHLPLWGIWMILGWLIYHFGVETALIKHGIK